MIEGLDNVRVKCWVWLCLLMRWMRNWFCIEDFFMKYGVLLSWVIWKLVGWMVERESVVMMVLMRRSVVYRKVWGWN